MASTHRRRRRSSKRFVMGEALRTLSALFAFMLIPVWIPLIAVAAGRVLDLVKRREEAA